MITLASNLYHLQQRSLGFSVASRELFGFKNAKIIEMQEETLATKMEEVVLKLVEKDGVDAVYFSTNKIALDGLVVLARHKIEVPERIGVICFDEAYAYSIFNTSLTYVKQPLGEIGGKAVEQLLLRMKGDATSQRIVLDTDIIEGNSSRILHKINSNVIKKNHH